MLNEQTTAPTEDIMSKVVSSLIKLGCTDLAEKLVEAQGVKTPDIGSYDAQAVNALKAAVAAIQTAVDALNAGAAAADAENAACLRRNHLAANTREDAANRLELDLRQVEISADYIPRALAKTL